jgi:autotransporter translocation and assembly factor TamB
LSIDNGTILVDAFEEDNIEEIQLEDSMKVGSTWSAEQDIFLDLILSLGNNLSIKNQAQPRLDLKPTGTIELTGKLDADSLQAFGSIQTTRGTLDVIGKRFNIEQASTLFDGNLMNPELKIIALYRVPRPHEVDIRHIITGRLQNPQFEYQSDPPMELQNIISYVLFNKPYYALDGWQQTLAGTNGNTGGAATDIAIQLLANRVERIASQRLGIDVVQIDNSRSGSNNATTLKTGWYLSEKTFFAILNELGVTNPQTQFLLEYYINQNLNLVITQDVEDGTRFDLRWQYDY